METKLTIVGSNIIVANNEMKTIALLPQLYPQDFVNVFIHKWFEM